MRFVDECTLRVEAGKGGDGCIAFRRERYLPMGGPSGGDGGKGGSVIFVADEGMGTLIDFQHVRLIRAKDGQMGLGSDCYGRAGDDQQVRVPVGTQVFNEDTGELMCELMTHGEEIIIAQGGNGGWGNIRFATPTDRGPRKANPGLPGEAFDLRLELKVLADVGLLGFPNVGKSTFISTVSRARPKVADYPFTTLVPHLGVVKLDDWIGADMGETLVAADIPGLVPGASEGAGLGIRFLKHLERTRVLLHLITLDHAEDREPLADYDVVRGELEKFDPELAQRPEVIALSKSDMTEVRDVYDDLKAKFAARGKVLHLMSAATRDGVSTVIHELATVLRSTKRD